MSIERKSANDAILMNTRQMKYKVKSNNLHLKRVEKLYTQPNNMKRKYSIKSSKFGNSKTIKEKQQLLEQNIQLKNINHELKKQINLEKTMIQHEKKKNKIFKNKLRIQFEKEMYYTNSTMGNQKYPNHYLVAGIKNQYEKLKEEYDKLSQKYNDLQHLDSAIKYQEQKIYSDSLLVENKRLRELLEVLNKVKPGKNDTVESLSLQIENMKLKEEKNKKKYDKLKEQYTEMKKEKKNRQTKIEFLQRLIVSKENKEFEMSTKNTRYSKEREYFKQQLQEKGQIIQNMEKQHSKQLQKLQAKFNLLQEKERQTFEHILKQKNSKIKALQKQIKYMTTVLSYWKPEQKSSRPHKESERITEKQLPIQKQEEQKEFLQINYEDMIPKEQEGLSNKSIDLISINRSQNLRARVRKTGSQKHNSHARKMRKVLFNDIEKISHFLRYRLIGLNIDKNNIAKYLQPKTTESQWNRQYINLRQVQQTLQQHPFSLKQQQAILLGRYIVEDGSEFQTDPGNIFVYWDEENQISRRVAQSILRASIGEYFLPNEKACAEKWQIVLQNHGKKVLSTLNSIVKHGVVSVQEWNQVLNGLQIEMEKDVNQWCIGKMLLSSESLNKLKYNIVLKDK